MPAWLAASVNVAQERGYGVVRRESRLDRGTSGSEVDRGSKVVAAGEALQDQIRSGET